MASEQNYFETSQATKWCENVNELLSDTNSTLKQASQLLQDLGTENTGTLGTTLVEQGSSFIEGFSEMAHGFATCVEVVARKVVETVKTLGENKDLLSTAARILGMVLGA